MKKKITCLLFLSFILTNSFSQNKDFTLKFDIVKSMFGVYQFEMEYHEKEQLSYGLGTLYMNTDTMLFFDLEPKEEGYMISPFIRYYTNGYNKPSSFYQANIRYMNFKGLGYKEWTNMISIDAVYGYQFRIKNSLFFEPSIGLGAFKRLDGDNAYGIITPYLLANFNISLKL